MAAPDFRAFSDPGMRQVRRELLDGLFAEDAQNRTRTFIRRHGGSIGAGSSGLTEVLSAWARGAATVRQAKGHPLTLRTYHQPLLDPVWAGAMAAMHLHAAGHDGSWRATFERPAPLRWNRWVSPALRGVSVAASHGEAFLDLVLRDGSTRSLTLSQSNETAPDGWTVLPSARLGAEAATLVILDASTRPVFPLAISYQYPAQSTERVARSVEEAGSILETYAPPYLWWVSEAVHALIPIARPTENGYQSGSDLGLHGVLYISAPVEPLKIAELLVHESSHQYLHYLQIDTLPTNGRDKGLYPSPYVGKDRSIDRILLSFHAFANIVLFYRSCLSAGLTEDRDLAEESIALHVPILTRFTDSLNKSPGLTHAGRELFEPLRDKLFQHDLLAT